MTTEQHEIQDMLWPLLCVDVTSKLTGRQKHLFRKHGRHSMH